MSNPFLVKVPAGYDSCDIKLVVVGQETHGWWGLWDGVPDRAKIGDLRSKYEKFERGRHHTRSPFFQGAYRLQELINPTCDRYTFAWLNLFPADQKQDLPSAEVADKLRDLNLLKEELAILEPNAVVFVTGPVYDFTIRKLFPDVTFSDLCPGAKIVQSAALPRGSVRTYHPNYLRRSKQFAVLDQIAAWIKSESSTSE